MPINFDWFDLKPYSNKYFFETGLFHGEGAMKALSSGCFEKVISVEVNAELVQLAQERFRMPIVAGLLQVVNDDSANLSRHISELEAPITFFLDAHGHWVRERRRPIETAKPVAVETSVESSDATGRSAAGACVSTKNECGDAAIAVENSSVTGVADADRDPFSANMCPLMQELEAIRQHPKARLHTILIDDRRCLQADWEHPTQSWWRGLSEEDVLQKLRQINPDYRISFIDGLVAGDIIVAVPP
eukprot:TRINITY_DN50277_c0_g1_i1.p1 TRINITY_DN50277_c0_g1~~TRINITY_DN50277_c0_g1_i1.p1  ORF type:complete len:246 (-),score=40.06 TRINITY_DN50277_c0_g1_i1:101-838(-)